MANISISLESNADIFNQFRMAIELDVMEWQALVVNGTTIPSDIQGNLQFKAKTIGPTSFTATASKGIGLANPNSILMIALPNNETAVAYLDYQSTPTNTILNGYIVVLPFSWTGAQSSPVQFSQINMTGYFSAT